MNFLAEKWVNQLLDIPLCVLVQALLGSALKDKCLSKLTAIIKDISEKSKRELQSSPSYLIEELDKLPKYQFRSLFRNAIDLKPQKRFLYLKLACIFDIGDNFETNNSPKTIFEVDDSHQFLADIGRGIFNFDICSLNESARCGAVRIFKSCLLNGVIPTSQTMKLAMESGCTEIIVLLIERFIKVDEECAIIALKHFNQTAFNWVLDEISSIDESTLLTAIIESDNLSAFLSKQAEPLTRIKAGGLLIPYYLSQMKMMLNIDVSHFINDALQYDDIELCELLLCFGISKEKLFDCAICSKYKCQTLLSRLIDQVDNKSSFPFLADAAEHRDEEFVNILLLKSFNPKIDNKRSVLHWAITRNMSIELLTLMIANGANVATSKDDLLNDALLSDRMDLLELLLSHQVRITSLSFMIALQQNKGVELFLKYGASPNKPLDQFTKMPPLFYALHDLSVVKLLIQYGADPSAQFFDEHGIKTNCLEQAVQNRYCDVAQYLVMLKPGSNEIVFPSAGARKVSTNKPDLHLY